MHEITPEKVPIDHLTDTADTDETSFGGFVTMQLGRFRKNEGRGRSPLAGD